MALETLGDVLTTSSGELKDMYKKLLASLQAPACLNCIKVIGIRNVNWKTIIAYHSTFDPIQYNGELFF